MRWRLSLALLIPLLGGCAAYYEEIWTNATGKSWPERWQDSDLFHCRADSMDVDGEQTADEIDAIVVACMRERGWSRTLVPHQVPLGQRLPSNLWIDLYFEAHQPQPVRPQP